MIAIESERLTMRELAADDLPLLMPIHLSNPAFLALVEGSEGEAGRYDLARWQRDWQVASMMPGRHMLGIFVKSTDEAVGFCDFFEEVDDGYPWFGVLTIHRTRQRQGLGTEACQCMLAYFRAEYGWPRVRTGIAERNTAGMAFARALGFTPIQTVERRLASGPQQILICERALAETTE